MRVNNNFLVRLTLLRAKEGLIHKDTKTVAIAMTVRSEPSRMVPW